MYLYLVLQMKLKGDKSGRKGHLSVATEVLALLPELQHWIYILVYLSLH